MFSNTILCPLFPILYLYSCPVLSTTPKLSNRWGLWHTYISHHQKRTIFITILLLLFPRVISPFIFLLPILDCTPELSLTHTSPQFFIYHWLLSAANFLNFLTSIESFPSYCHSSASDLIISHLNHCLSLTALSPFFCSLRMCYQSYPAKIQLGEYSATLVFKQFIPEGCLRSDLFENWIIFFSH